MDYLAIVKLVVSSSSGIMKLINRRQAYDKAKKYLSDKYNLSIGSRTIGAQYPVSVDTYDSEWADLLLSLLNEIQRAYSYDVDICETSGDAYLIVNVLSFVSDNPDYPANRLRKTNTLDSLADLSRGRGTEVLLKLVQKELNELL